jgi:secreted PhoX family phosphatase
MRTSVDRRVFLHHALLAGGASMALPLEAFVARVMREGAAAADGPGYGPLGPVKDESTGLPLLQLPEGFRYVTFGWTGDPMEGGARTPGLHDGMAAFAGDGGRVRLVRNHEVASGPVFEPTRTYDPAAGGGTTTLEFDTGTGKVVSAHASLAGTVRNCAGGPTPWGTWLSCEETVLGPGSVSSSLAQPFTKEHGYIFEVPTTGFSSCQPLTAMGRFVHEAIAVDPRKGIVYETEDAQQAGLYRFIPSTPGDLAKGGRLEMLAVRGQPRLDTRTGRRIGEQFSTAWVPIGDPTRAHESPATQDGRGVFSQGLAHGGAIFARLEGAWWGADRLFFTATSGGAAKMGQVWELDPAQEVLRLVYESPGADVLNMPDNLCVSPRGGLVVCEDGTANPCMHGLTTDGRIFRFARNNIVLNGERSGISGDFRTSELAGATFSPDGKWLFFSVQSPGLTVAVTGPWNDGGL